MAYIYLNPKTNNYERHYFFGFDIYLIGFS